MIDPTVALALVQEAQEQFQTTLDGLQRPDNHHLLFSNHPFADNNKNAQRLGRALLSETTHLTSMHLTVQHLTQRGGGDELTDLLQFLQTTESVQTVTLDGYGDHAPSPSACPLVIGQFLRALARSHIPNVEIQGCFGALRQDWVDFFSDAQNVRDLELDCCDYVDERYTNDLSFAIERNTSLRRLYLEINRRTWLHGILHLLSGLPVNSTLQHLALEWSMNDRLKRGMVLLLQFVTRENRTLSHLELQQFPFINLELFDLGHLQVLNLQSCRFDARSTQSLMTKIKQAPNLQELALVHSQFATPLPIDVLLKFRKLRLTRNLFTNQLAKAIATCQTLQTLCLFSLSGPSLGALIENLPRFAHLRHLEVESMDDTNTANGNTMEQLVQAIFKNSSLHTCSILPERVLLRNRTRLQHALHRNRGLQEWASRTACPCRLAEAAQCSVYGPDMIFRALSRYQQE